MQPRIFFLVTLLTILSICTIAYAQEKSEEITLSTYYPAPYGDYDGLTGDRVIVNRQIVGNMDVDGDNVDSDLNDITAVPGGNLLVENNVGIGTTSPQAKLHIDGTAGTDGIMFPDGTLQTTAGGVPPGSIVPYAGSSAPNGWLLCAGQTLTEGGMGETYEALYNVIGTTYGGSGASNFRVPDLRGRLALGRDNMGGTSAGRVTATEADNLGQGSGAETHTLTVSELPSHRHHSGAYLERTGWGNPTMAYGGINANSAVRTGSGWGVSRMPYTNYVGSGQAHNKMPPYLTLSYIIKY